MTTTITIPAPGNPIFPTSPTPNQTSFVQRLLQFTIQLNPNPPMTNQPTTFPGGSNTLTISGSRATARIQHAGAMAKSQAQVDIFGLTPSVMNQLSTLGMVFQLVQQNTIIIEAGDPINGLTLVFIGTITSAYGDYNQQPNVPFHFEAIANLVNAVAPMTPSSYQNSTDVGSIMQGLARQMGLGFENNGVSVQLPSGYYPGSAQDQYQKVAGDAGIIANVVPGANGAMVLAIWPKGGSRGGVAPSVSPTTGMIGYPTYTQYGILVKTIFNPQVAFGGQIQVQSSLPNATGTWSVLRLDHSLDSLVPSGLWESSIWCFNPKYPQPTSPP